MNISIFGLGYVGVVAAACLARDGHKVIGVDNQITKVAMLNGGRAPIVERGVAEMIKAAIAAGRLSATNDARAAVTSSDVSLICVGTVGRANGAQNLDHIHQVCREICAALRDKGSFHLVVARSTLLPGTTRSMLIPALEAASGLRAGVDFGVAVNPEFLREGSAVEDYDQPPMTLFGVSDQRSEQLLNSLYAPLQAPLLRVEFEVAEALKYAQNIWLGVKVAFANEIGAVCKAVGVDSHAVMDIFVRNTKLNISPNYLRPGMSFGGSCLPKDLRAFLHLGRSRDLDLPLLESVLPSNEAHTRRARALIEAQGSKQVGVLGITFKAHTDDLRESPMIDVVQDLLGHGYKLKVFDPNVNLAVLHGANRDYIVNHIPHIHELLADSMEDVLAHGDTIVVGTNDEAFARLTERLRPGQKIVDLAGLGAIARGTANYQGLCW